MKPLTLTSYTCIVDINVRVRGGGVTGQAESIIPALSRALQNFDIRTRRPLKVLNLLKNDIRKVERKKAGHYKARKGYVYRRR